MWVVSLNMGVVPGCTVTFGYDGAPRLRGRRHVVTDLSVLCNPPRLGIHIGVRKLPHEVAGRPVLGGLPVHFILRAKS